MNRCALLRLYKAGLNGEMVVLIASQFCSKSRSPRKSLFFFCGVLNLLSEITKVRKRNTASVRDASGLV